MLTKEQMEKLIEPLKGCDAFVMAWHNPKDNNIQQIIAGDIIGMDLLLASLINRIYEKTGCPYEVQLDGLKDILEQVKDKRATDMNNPVS